MILAIPVFALLDQGYERRTYAVSTRYRRLGHSTQLNHGKNVFCVIQRSFNCSTERVFLPVTKRQFTLMVDGKLRRYDHPPEPPGYTVEQLTIRQWIEDWLAKERAEQRKESE